VKRVDDLKRFVVGIRVGWGGLRMGGILNTIDGDYHPRSVHREG
jgi:hypothetical protein